MVRLTVGSSQEASFREPNSLPYVHFALYEAQTSFEDLPSSGIWKTGRSCNNQAVSNRSLRKCRIILTRVAAREASRISRAGVCYG